MLEKRPYHWPFDPPISGTAQLRAELVCHKFTPGDEDSCHEAKGDLSVTLAGIRDFKQWLPGGGDYSYVEKSVVIARLWEAKVTLWLPWGCCDDWKIHNDYHNPLGLSEDDAHDLVQTTGICDYLAALIEKAQKAQ